LNKNSKTDLDFEFERNSIEFGNFDSSHCLTSTIRVLITWFKIHDVTLVEIIHTRLAGWWRQKVVARGHFFLFRFDLIRNTLSLVPSHAKKTRYIGVFRTAAFIYSSPLHSMHTIVFILSIRTVQLRFFFVKKQRTMPACTHLSLSLSESTQSNPTCTSEDTVQVRHCLKMAVLFRCSTNSTLNTSPQGTVIRKKHMVRWRSRKSPTITAR
jgi:hypothetical protein